MDANQSLSMEPQAAAPWPRRLWTATLLLVLLGCGWRIVRYSERFPIWGDEAFVCLNFLDRDYAGLLQPLKFSQVAPVLFLWCEWTVYHYMGGSELALRLLPLLAGLGGLILFWRTARIALSPLAGALAVGLLAVSYYPVRHCCEVKPYAFDLLMSVTLLLPAAAWLNDPTKLRPLLLLTLLLPIALGISYPAVFVAGSVSVALLPLVWRQRNRRTWLMFVLYNCVLLASFAGWYFLVGVAQFTSTHGEQNVQWDMWFLPWQWSEMPKWLAAAHTGNMFAYPIGSQNGGSILTTLCCALGAWQLAKGRRWELLLLCVAPFALSLTAAALHRYPYGGSARVAQHLAPVICLLTGNGMAFLVPKLRLGTLFTKLRFEVFAAITPTSEAELRGVRSQAELGNEKLTQCVLATLALIGIGGLVRDLVKPYKTDGDRIARRLAGVIAANAGPDDQVVVLDEDWRLPPGMEWYLRQNGVRVLWNGKVDEQRLERSTKQLWVLSFLDAARRRTQIEMRLTSGPRPFVKSGEAEYRFSFGWDPQQSDRCQLFHWVEAAKDTESSGIITAEGDARSSDSKLVPAALDKPR